MSQVDVGIVGRHHDRRRHRIDREAPGASGRSEIAVGLLPGPSDDTHGCIADVRVGGSGEGRGIFGQPERGADQLQIAQRSAGESGVGQRE